MSGSNFKFSLQFLNSKKVMFGKLPKTRPYDAALCDISKCLLDVNVAKNSIIDVMGILNLPVARSHIKTN